MLDQGQDNDAEWRNPDDGKPNSGRVGNDSIYLAALKKTAPAAAIAGVGGIVIVNLLIATILDRYPKITDYWISVFEDFSGDAAVVGGLVVAVVIWLVLGAFYARQTFALGDYHRHQPQASGASVGEVGTVLGSALFLPAMGVSTFATPEEGQAYLAGIEEFAKLPDTFADTVFALTSLVVIILLFVGNVLLGIAVWRSGTLPRQADALWAGAAVLMYPFGIVYAATIGVQSTPRTVLVGALLIVVGGRWPCEHCTGPPSGWWASKPSPECNSQPPGDRRVRIHARRHWTTGRGGTSRCKQP